MAQIQQRAQIRSFSGMNGGGWTAITVPIGGGCRRVTVRNPDIVDTIDVCTDTADASAVVTISAGDKLALESALDDRGANKWKAGDTVAYVRGGGDQPILVWEA